MVPPQKRSTRREPSDITFAGEWFMVPPQKWSTRREPPLFSLMSGLWSHLKMEH